MSGGSDEPAATTRRCIRRVEGRLDRLRGKLIMVGRVKGDPERFAAGSGPELPYGQSLAFGDYRCRSDQAGLVCVNYAFQSAARFSDAGVQPFGCLKPSAPMPQVGKVFSC